MFHKVHFRLCALFTGITAFIILFSSLLLLYTANRNLRDAAYLSFKNDMGSFVSNLENQKTIRYDWLSKTEQNGTYLITLFDNGNELSYGPRTKSSAQISLLKEALEYYYAHSEAADTESIRLGTHSEFSFSASDGQDYYGSFCTILRNDGKLEAIIVHPLTALTRRIRTQYLFFLLLDACTVLLLTLFCWYFTKRLLFPIEESQKRQTRFISAVSHELRTPLSVILSSSSALKNAKENDRNNFLDIINSEGRRMSDLLMDMLTLTSADNHSWIIHKTFCELDTLVLNSFESFESMFLKKQISLTVHLPEQILPRCFCDSSRITQVLGIFLNNALHYGADKVNLSLDFNEKEGFEIRIEDNGCGIPDSEKKLVFERFYRGDPSRSSREHFGLGLCIAKEIADAHHGKICILDTEGGGCTILLILPYKHD